MAPRIPRTEHFDDASSCHDQPSECSPYPAPILPTPLPLPRPPPSSSSSPGSSDGRSTFFVTALIIAGSALAFVIICLFVFLFVRRRRQQRREALLEATAAAPAAVPDDGGGPDQQLGDDAEQGGEVDVHHAWHIRTVGLDEAAIESIALTRYYRAGAGVLGGASDDCAVCLGEFADGELLRLLPRCAHAFHVRCIDTWLRAHVNCPLCRSQVQVVLDAAAPDAAGGGQAASSNVLATERERPDRHAQASEQRELRLQIDQNDDGRSISPEQQPHRHHPGPRVGNIRRVVSMDSQSSPIEEAAPDASGDKQGTTGGAVHCEFLPGCSGRLNNHHRGMKRSLSVDSLRSLVSRHCRRSGSVLPL